MKRGDWLRIIKASGKTVYEIRHPDPLNFSENLRRGARLRGYRWTFTVKENIVYVYVKDET